MKFFSETLKRTFDTAEDCLKAEKEAEDKKTARQKDAAEVDKLQKKYIEAYNDYCKAVKDFVDKYGSYKTTYEKDALMPFAFSDLFKYAFTW